MSSSANPSASNPTVLLARDSFSPPGRRTIGSRPFYRSQVTPEPFDFSNQQRALIIRTTPQRRFSVQQLNVLDDDDNASISSSSSDESLSLEFPPPPSAFLTPSISDKNQQKTSNFVSRSDSGSSLSNSYFSDQESSTTSRPPMKTNFNQIFRTNNPSGRALISVSSGQTPVITIAGSPQRSQIRVSSSSQNSGSTLREIRISRPDSPSISINRTATSQPLILTTNGNPNSATITNGNNGAFHISLGRNSPSIHRDSNENNRLTNNVVSNRIHPFLTFSSNHFNQRNSPQLETQFNKSSLKTESNLLGLCARCNDQIVGEENRLDAMDRMYHVSCFTCTMCGCRLRGMHFYSMENQPYCESCYISSLEKCNSCGQTITDRILRATGKAYHAECFSCVACEKSLDGVPFTVDAKMEIHCIECFNQKFAPRCFSCHRPILPNSGQHETNRIIALDRSYHIECYRCENCQVPFSDDEACFPIDEQLFCSQCNRLYTRTVRGQS